LVKQRKLKPGALTVTGPLTITGLGVPNVHLHVEEKTLTEREKVYEKWAKMTEEQRYEVCRTCVSYFPKDEGKFECLSGHGIKFEKPCPSFSQAVFRLCDDWEYTPRQVYLIRELEKVCKSAVGEWDDDDED